jgi:hypothetical protein
MKEDFLTIDGDINSNDGTSNSDFEKHSLRCYYLKRKSNNAVDENDEDEIGVIGTCVLENECPSDFPGVCILYIFMYVCAYV